MKKSIKVSVNPVTTTSTFAHSSSHNQRDEGALTKVRKWFTAPLSKMAGDEGFLVLLTIFPLYEKLLRIEHNFTDKFKKGHRVFKVIGREFGLSEADAYAFWKHMRNGLLHQVQPKTSSTFEYGIRINGNPVEKIEGRFWINPFALRDQLIPKIESSARRWKSDDVPVAVTFDPVES